MTGKDHKYTNALAGEDSPYLKQHAHNPVDWVPWSGDLERSAEKEGKLLLVSIGYAACHWCHVMEHQCFEDEEVARVMNKYFISVKVDREERPDIDHIYMDALQMMTGSGGWPLNVVALPDGRPFWGATFVKKDDWIKVLQQLATLYREDPEKIREYADKLARGLKEINLVSRNTNEELLSQPDLEEIMARWKKGLDLEMGGNNRAPKFMMPVNLNFLLHYAHSKGDPELLEYVHNTLTKMAYGGLYDQLGGGFSRYSVDVKWHVPHFEKMLYDNGQMISLYSRAYAQRRDPLYREVVEETITFVRRELMHPGGGFYASLDADSIDDNGILTEGAFYTWSKEELKDQLGKEYDLFADYYNLNDYGYWEDGRYVLIRNSDKASIAERWKISESELNNRIQYWKQQLLPLREQRPRPRLDDKLLTSWNALMLKGLLDAFRYLENSEYLDLARINIKFIEEKLLNPDYSLKHAYSKKGRTIPGYLEDYATLADALITFYELTFEEKWLSMARKLTDRTITHFADEESGLFFFTSDEEEVLIRRTLEVTDNVIPASNSIMAHNLFRLSRYFPSSGYEAMAKTMLINIHPQFENYAPSHANWMQLLLFFSEPYFEIAVVGDDYEQRARELRKEFIPNCSLAGTRDKSEIPLLRERHTPGKTLIYICRNNSCQLPVTSAAEALDQIT
ncbi:thioredoxin domain-containing protein [Zeaxanthinibacter enoshimensis]|uniref:thioredoxin domain-containing protein n=1 Tax=Zeaxanthinibacter enoshimensis TaxID=392009 RepID=UPI003565D68C